jgi:hypothetical protein
MTGIHFARANGSPDDASSNIQNKQKISKKVRSSRFISNGDERNTISHGKFNDKDRPIDPTFEISIFPSYTNFGTLKKFSDDGSDPKFQAASGFGLNLGFYISKTSPLVFNIGYGTSSSDGSFPADTVIGKLDNGNNVFVANGGAVTLKYSIITLGITYYISNFFVGINIGSPKAIMNFSLTDGTNIVPLEAKLGGSAYSMKAGYQFNFLTRYFLNMRYEYQLISFNKLEIANATVTGTNKATFNSSQIALDFGVKF